MATIHLDPKMYKELEAMADACGLSDVIALLNDALTCYQHDFEAVRAGKTKAIYDPKIDHVETVWTPALRNAAPKTAEQVSPPHTSVESNILERKGNVTHVSFRKDDPGSARE